MNNQFREFFETLSQDRKEALINVDYEEAIEENEKREREKESERIKKETRNRVRKIAFITYNFIGNGEYKDGIVKKGTTEIHISQSDYSKYTDINITTDRILDDRRSDERFVKRVLDNVMDHVQLEEMDHTYLYIGKKTSRELIARTRNLASEKLTYVMCDCDSGEKSGNIKNFGKEGAEVIWCECGGRRTMKKLLEEELNSDNKKREN